jgi:hypothetical protein
MLSPFEAFALAKYTNAPIEQRLEMLSATMSLITNALASDRPILHLEINGTKIASCESPKLGENLNLVPILLNTNRQIGLHIFNDSEVTAEHITIDFMAPVDSTNILADQWILEPKNPNGWNQWHSVAADSYGDIQVWSPQTVVISQGFKQRFLTGEFFIHADRSATWAYAVSFIFQN